MAAKRDVTVAVRIAEPLHQALEVEAAADDRTLSALIRRILVEHAVARATEQAQQAA